MRDGRPLGGKNKPGHNAGGSRANSGRKKLRIDEMAGEIDLDISAGVSDSEMDFGECILVVLLILYMLTLWKRQIPAR